MKVKCPHCETIQNAPDDADVEEVMCKACGGTIALGLYAPEVREEIEEKTPGQQDLPCGKLAYIWTVIRVITLLAAALIALCGLMAMVDSSPTGFRLLGISFSMAIWCLLLFTIVAIIQAIHANTRAIQELYAKERD
ncbi:MAG: hypothetical protein J7M40_15010 [Planctomycetes bacterium]|nr:hypothetical protein [Planctomycetota bacterium]